MARKDLSLCHAVGLGAERSLDTGSHRPRSNPCSRGTGCSQPVPTPLDPPGPQATGGAGGAPGLCQPPSCAQDSQEPARQLEPKSGQKWK